MSIYNECTWHPIIKWVSFFPLGLLTTGVIQAYLRWVNSETPFIAELLSRAVEPWAFFFISLWVLPKFHKIYIAAISIVYILIYLGTIYFTTVQEGFSVQPWVDYSISTVAIVSCSIAAFYFMRETYSDNESKT